MKSKPGQHQPLSGGWCCPGLVYPITRRHQRNVHPDFYSHPSEFLAQSLNSQPERIAKSRALFIHIQLISKVLNAFQCSVCSRLYHDAGSRPFPEHHGVAQSKPEQRRAAQSRPTQPKTHSAIQSKPTEATAAQSKPKQARIPKSKPKQLDELRQKAQHAAPSLTCSANPNNFQDWQ